MPDHSGLLLDNDLLNRALAATRDGISIADALLEDLPLIYVNPAFEKMTGYRAGEVLGKNCRFLQQGQADAGVTKTLRRAISHAAPCLVTLRNFRKDGSAFWNELSIAPIRDSYGQLTHFIGVQKDVTARVEATRRLSAEKIRLESLSEDLTDNVHRDALTDIFNRRYFQSRLETEWRRAQRNATPLACLMVGVDDFKAYNDRYGHLAGDECLKRVASALNDVFRRAGVVVARYGGEEFVVLGNELDLGGGQQLGEQLRNAIEALAIPHEGARGGSTLTVSVGVAAVHPSDAFSANALVAAADAALYDAKSRGRNCVVCGLMTADLM